ncbi:MAG: zinc ribbon domain-containing protein, partial [Acidimicrobiales bacterium]
HLPMPHPILDLQALDLRADQLQHSLDGIPQRAQLAVQLELIAQQHADRDVVAAELHVLQRHEKRIEDEHTTVEDKIEREKGKLYGGTHTGTRELQALEDEIASLNRRQSDLETEALELLDQADPLNDKIEGMNGGLQDVEAQADQLRGTLATAEAEIGGELKAVLTPRDELVAAVPPSILKEYIALREHRGGVVVSEMQGDLCGACQLHLTPREVDRIRALPADKPAHCECGSLLIHT